MRAPNRAEVASGAALFAAYPAFIVAEHHDLIGHELAHYGVEAVTVVVLGNLVWCGAVNSPAANWARGRAGKAWHRLTTLRHRVPPPPPPSRFGPSDRPAKTLKHPADCDCHGEGVVHLPCPSQSANTEV